MQLQIGKTLESTPVGCRLVFSLSVGSYLLFIFNHHEFISLDLVCRPVDVIFGWQVQRLFLASFVHTSLLGLLLALLVCWRRFSWLERQTGTLGFLVWFAWSSAVLHSAHCLAMLCLSPILGWDLLGSEVHGLFPILTANLVLSIKDSDSSTVWLWPLPFHVSIRAFPVVIIGLSWLFHLQVHFDVITAYILASTCPAWFMEPSQDMLDRLEQTTAAKWLLAQLQVSDAFVFRQPAGGSCGSPVVPKQSTGTYHADCQPVVSSAPSQSTSAYHADRAAAMSSATDMGSLSSAELGLPLTLADPPGCPESVVHSADSSAASAGPQL
mmetsp:Transcript_52405/g.94072  ORF Transcript_52405/g.94072 Transcript_52405/m.94072 type:complete len:325 (-) Transcript_52405:56-1030(-)